MLVNNIWCNPGYITVKEMICTQDIQLLAVSFLPYFPQPEFTCVVLIALYILPGDTANTVCDIISLAVATYCEVATYHSAKK